MLDSKKNKYAVIRGLRKNSQRSIIAKHLLKNGCITTWDAIMKYKITRLSGRIFDLKDIGMNIESVPDNEKGKNFVRYSLVSNKVSDTLAIYLLPSREVNIYEKYVRKHA